MVDDGWIIGPYHFTENPRYIIEPRLTRLCRQWLDMRAMGASGGAGMIGAAMAIMPTTGGYLDQPAFVMDAFRMFDHWMRERGKDG